jgi:hypothetical protein
MIEPSGVSWVRVTGTGPRATCKPPKQLTMFLSCHTTQGYHGTALGKNKQAAHAEIEKLDLKELSARELLKEAARMCVAFGLMLPLANGHAFFLRCRLLCTDFHSAQRPLYPPRAVCTRRMIAPRTRTLSLSSAGSAKVGPLHAPSGDPPLAPRTSRLNNCSSLSLQKLKDFTRRCLTTSQRKSSRTPRCVG